MKPKTIGYIVGGLALVAGSILGLAKLGGYRGSILQVCVNHTGAGMHIHPNLEIMIDGVTQTIPKDIGVGGACMRPIHTHDESGRIHVEFPGKRDFTLGDFFTLWSKPFDETHLLDKVVDNTHEIIMTVNDQPSTEFRNQVLKDGDKIVLKYQTKP